MDAMKTLSVDDDRRYSAEWPPEQVTRRATHHARAIVEAADVETLSRVVAKAACDALAVARCSVYLRDGKAFTGRAAFPGADLDEAVRGLRIGTTSDQLTRRIVEHGGPLVLRDLQSAPGVAGGTLRAWGVTAILGIPLVHDEQTLGLLVVDHAGQAHPFGDGHLAVARELAGLTVAALLRLEADRQRDTELRGLRVRSRALGHTLASDERLCGVMLDDGGTEGIVAAGAALLRRPIAVYDASGHRVGECGAEDDPPVRLLEVLGKDPDLMTLLRDVPAGGSAQVPAMLADGLRHRHLAASIDVAGRQWGWVVTAEHRTRLSVLDDRTIRRIAAYVALELTVQRRAAVASLDARSTLARLLIRGTHDATEVLRCAAFLGIVLEAPRVVVYVTDAEARSTIDDEALVRALRSEGFDDVLATKGPEGVALMIEVPRLAPTLEAVARVKASVTAACATLGVEGLVAGISTVCRHPQEMPRGYREARETARCVTRVTGEGHDRIMAADDLGAARLFVANTEAVALNRFVIDVLGPLLDEGETESELLRTLHVLFDHARNVRQSAAVLGIHENTVRYRLARIHQLTGLDVAGDANAQLSVQTALLVLRLRDPRRAGADGHLGLRSAS